ncbi:MAG: hypothetical protein JOY68_02175 [Candidatus Dormibacteraeota bacterium]|nr:hypothetical protein [Candidatus Dormibacteraeota bacterium]
MLVVVAAASLSYALATRFGVIGAPDFREGLVTADRPLALDPYVGTPDQGADDVAHLLYRSLFRLDATAYPAPDLAASYSLSPDGRSYTVQLAHARWSDGTPVTPADVVATLQLAASAGSADSAVTGSLAGLAAKAIPSGVVLTLLSPRAALPALLTEVPILPLGRDDASHLAQLEHSPQTVLPTSGPYAVKASSASDLLLTANPHATERPRLSSFDLRLYASFDDAAAAFTRGDVDGLMATTPAQRARLLAVHGAHAGAIATFGFVDLLFNEQAPGLDDPVVRQVVAAVIARDGLVAGALDGLATPQSGAIPIGLRWVGAPHLPAPAPTAAAEAMLQNDGWVSTDAGVRSRSGVSLSFTVSVPDVDPLPDVAHELALQLAPLGISVAPDIVQAPTFLSTVLVPHSFQMALGDWNAGPDPDVSTFWRSNALPPHGYNVSDGPTDPFLDQALDRLATLSDRGTRIAAAAQVDRLLAQDAPAVVLYAPDVWFVFRISMHAAPLPPVGGSAARYDDVASWQR